jgi:superfamily II DNA or RNA helicase
MTFSSLLRRFDSRPDIRGRQFELLCRWYLQNAPEYRRRFTKVWLWKDWPEAWAADAGIDLVAEEHDGSRWAIQAKAYGENYAIKKADVDSFLSESNRPHFSYRLLVATTDRIGATARRTLDGQRVPVGYLLRSQLELAQVQWPSSLDSLCPRRPKAKKPFPHVREAIRATVKGFDGTERGQLIMACGTGKTLVGLWSSERLQSVRTLVLLPSLSLLAQTLREWTANATQPFDYLAVCSDETVVGEDEFVASTAELGVPVTTDPIEISTFLRRRGRRVVFSTYQSSPQIAAAQRRRAPLFDLAIADEAHRCAGRVASDFATVLDGGKIKSRRRLFMTATPRFYTPRVRREARQLDVEVASMDDMGVFGKVFHRLSFGEAIKRNLLSDYQVVIVGVTNSTYRTYAGRGELVTRDSGRVTDARTLAGQIGLAKTMQKWDLRRVVSFHGRVKAARQFSTDMPDVIAWMPLGARPKGALWSEHVSGAMSSGHRDRLLLRFRNLDQQERGLLSNARCLGEGVDVPSIDGVAFIDPRHSTIDIIQALGRAIRKAPDKKVGTIVLPVFLPADADPGAALDDSSFRHVWDVLKALRAHDDSLGEELDELRRRLGAQQARLARPAKIHLDVPTAVGQRFARAFDVRLVELTTASWEFWFGLLQRYVEREKHPEVPADHTEDGFRLGQWVNVQRVAYRAGALSAERTSRLQGLSGWRWAPHSEKWEAAFAALKNFTDREGEARMTESHVEKGFPLGRWVALQRRIYNSRTRRLSAARVQRLEALAGWTWDPFDALWEEGFGYLMRFVQREGHSRVTRFHVEDGFALGHWVSAQRVARRRGRDQPELETRLESLPGWSWDVKSDTWEDYYRHLRDFSERVGHARPALDYIENGRRLGRWVSSQRTVRKRRKLDTTLVERLESLPGWTWDPAKSFWEDAHAALTSFVAREGHARVPSSHVEDGLKLGSWVAAQRVARRRTKLQADRVERLDALPGWHWEVRAERWEHGFARVQKFAEREGHARISATMVEDGFKLGQWVTLQRTARRLKRLSSQQIKRLEALPGWTWDARMT